MKQINIICNNILEYNHFCESLEWSLSKQNKRYKRVRESMVDIDKQVKYVYTRAHEFVEDGNEEIWMCNKLTGENK